MKRYTTKLRSKSSVGPFKMNLLVLVVQVIVMSKNADSRMTSIRSNSPDKFANLNNSIRCQLMQLHPELASNIQNDRVRRHAETSSKEIFEHHCFIIKRIWNGLCTRSSAISFQKIMSNAVQRGYAGLSNP
jgi:2-oxo-4-hydroxy-4-carboxy--5-ureidoimidazoline (OHCU) decarboxylase